MIDLQTFQLGGAITHGATPHASVTVHLKIGLQIETLGERGGGEGEGGRGEREA